MNDMQRRHTLVMCEYLTTELKSIIRVLETNPHPDTMLSAIAGYQDISNCAIRTSMMAIMADS